MKEDLTRYLQQGREALVWKLDGLDEYDIRRPMVRTGTNLLGLVKHMASVEVGYFGTAFDRPFPEVLASGVDAAEPNADMWATRDESRAFVVDLYRRVWAHADETINSLELESMGAVPWWPADRRNVPLRRVLLHVIVETHRHAGHADIIRELIDGSVGRYRTDPSHDDFEWDAYRSRLEQVARDAAD